MKHTSTSKIKTGDVVRCTVRTSAYHDYISQGTKYVVLDAIGDAISIVDDTGDKSRIWPSIWFEVVQDA